MFRRSKTKLAILISNAGTGTNLRSIAEAVGEGKIKAKIVAVVSDREDAPGLLHARMFNLKIVICPKKENLLKILQKLNPDYICLAGWKQIIEDSVIRAYPNKILNMHPGLIPDSPDGIVKNPDGTDALWNKGMLTTKAIQNFFTKKITYVGSTLHFLTLNFDYGPVLGRVFEEVRLSDTVDSVYKRLKEKENEMYAKTLEKLCE